MAISICPKIVLSNDDMKSIDAMVESLAEDKLKEPFRRCSLAAAQGKSIC